MITVVKWEELILLKFQLSLWIIHFCLECNGVVAESQMFNVRINVYKRDCLHNVEFPSKGKSAFLCVVLVCLTLVGSKFAYVYLCQSILLWVATMWLISFTTAVVFQCLFNSCWAKRWSVARQCQQMSSWEMSLLFCLGLQLLCRNVSSIHSDRLFFSTPSRNQHLSHPSWEIELYSWLNLGLNTLFSSVSCCCTRSHKKHALLQ